MDIRRVDRSYCTPKVRSGSFTKGHIPWNKGKKIGPMSEEQKEKRRQTQKGKNYSPNTQFKKGHQGYWKGKKRSEEYRLKMSKVMSGETSSFWKGGITPINQLIRTSAEFKIWRNSVFERDDYTCQQCEKRGGDLNAHHIKSFADYPEQRFDVENGMTLCVKCHRKTFGGKNGHKAC